jgi:hypothetical protein
MCDWCLRKQMAKCRISTDIYNQFKNEIVNIMY